MASIGPALISAGNEKENDELQVTNELQLGRR